MTPRMRSRFKRPLGQRRYRRLFVLAAEGQKTEPDYFNLFRTRQGIHIVFVPTKGASSPDNVLRAMQKYLRHNPIMASDEAWIIIDTDSWTEEQLAVVHAWSTEAPGRGLGVSNPMFEYWLLLHFEDGDNVAGARECLERLVRQLPTYEKGGLPLAQLEPRIDEAVGRARRRDTPRCLDWPRLTGTTVYRLVERLRAD